jgi:hypothetical protein
VSGPLVGRRDERIVIDHAELRQPYVIRPAARVDDDRGLPDWAEVAIRLALWVALPLVFWTGVALVALHALGRL